MINPTESNNHQGLVNIELKKKKRRRMCFRSARTPIHNWTAARGFPSSSDVSIYKPRAMSSTTSTLCCCVVQRTWLPKQTKQVGASRACIVYIVAKQQPPKVNCLLWLLLLECCRATEQLATIYNSSNALG